MKYGINFFVLFYLLFNFGTVAANETVDEFNPAAINIVLDKAERELKRNIIRIKKIEAYFVKVKVYRVWSSTCVTDNENALSELILKTDVLGKKVTGESLSVTKKRNDLFKEESNLKKSLSSCNVISLRTVEVSDAINLVKQNMLAQQLLAQGPGYFKLISENWDNPSIWTEALKTFVIEHSGLLDIKLSNILILIIFLVVISLLSKFYSNKITKWNIEHTPKPLLLSQLICALVTTAQRYIMVFPAVLFTVAFTNVTNIDVAPKPFVVIVLNGFGIVLALNIIIHFFLNSSLSIYKYETKTKAKVVNLVHRLKVLGFIIFFGYILFSTLFFHDLPEAVLYISRGTYGTIFVLNIVWIIWLLGYFHKLGNNLIVRMALTLVFIFALISEWNGYRNLSIYIIEVVIGTLFLLGLYSIISKLISEFMDSLDKGNIQSALRVRNWLGVKDDQRIQGLFWVRLIISLLMWIGLVSLLILVWQIPETYSEILILKIFEGINIGSFRLVPLEIFEAVVVFSLVLVMSSWFKRRLEKSWLPKTNMTRSARESMATISGYVGILIASIFALSFIGMDFSKLAIVAGALSVGIGFGLQNVVNNFISGLILLFERPIKTGDWIVVGETEGHVKRISIRSTHIQTFDRADVIVPNSEIISGTVTNWMLRDRSGRLRLPISVAYGTNTETVRDLLLEVATNHTEIIAGNSVIADPQVLFMDFGDSSLNFELRCYIYNVDNRRVVMSDLNFAVDKIFRENNISIPFPQREIRIIKDQKDLDLDE